jgi:hypothetical protein
MTAVAIYLQGKHVHRQTTISLQIIGRWRGILAPISAMMEVEFYERKKTGSNGHQSWYMLVCLFCLFVY